MQRLTTLCLLIALLAAGRCDAARGGPAGGAGPAFFRQLSSRCTTFLLITDPAPALRRALVSPAMKHILVESKLAKLAKSGKPLPAPSQLVESLYQNLFRIPAELAIGTTPEGMENAARLFRIGTLIALVKAARTAGADGAKKIPTLLARIDGEMKKVELPEVCVWVRMRRTAEASAFLSGSAQVAQQVASRFGAQVDAGADSVKLTWSPAALFDEDAAARFLQAVGVVAAPAEPEAARLGATLRAIRLEVRAERKDDAVRVLFGAWRAEGLPLMSEKLGPLWESGPAPYAFARWDVSGFRDGLAKLDALVEELGDASITKALDAVDTEDGVADLRRMARRVADMPQRGTARLEAEPHLQVVMRQEIARPPAPLAGSGIARFVPAASEAFSATTDESIARSWEEGIAKFEDRLETQRLKADLRGKKEHSRIIEGFADWYYKEMGPSRKVVLETAPAYFDKELTVVARPATATSRIAVERRAPGAPGTLELAELPLPQAAIVGKLKPGAKVEEFFVGVQAAFTGRPKDQVKLTTADAGLGTPAWMVTAATLEKLPGGLSVKPGGDLVLHAVVVDGYLIFSSSVALTRDLISARAKGPSMTPPAGLGDGVSAYGRVTARMLRAMFDDIARWAGGKNVKSSGALASEKLDAELSGVQRGFETVADLVAPFDRLEWWTALAGDELATVFRLVSARTPAR